MSCSIQYWVDVVHRRGKFEAGALAGESVRKTPLENVSYRVLHGWMALWKNLSLTAITSPRIIGWEIRSGS
jgi:hypothetical protein